MKLEAIGKPFTYRWPTGEVRLAPGHPVTLPDDRAARLLETAPGRVRVVPTPGTASPALQPGCWVEWHSPALPNSQGEVLEVDEAAKTFLVFHPRTEALRWLPISWIARRGPSLSSLFDSATTGRGILRAES